MDKLASSAFRKYFAKLDAPTQVTVNGHVIGMWLPGAAPITVATNDLDGSGWQYPKASTPKTQQASRDAILRKINRGG